jgi:hypothetical protein
MSRVFSLLPGTHYSNNDEQIESNFAACFNGGFVVFRHFRERKVEPQTMVVGMGKKPSGLQGIGHRPTQIYTDKGNFDVT